MVNRGDIGVRTRKKSLMRLNMDKAKNPEKYNHQTSDKSLFLAMKYDYDRGILPEYKMEQFEKLQKEFEEKEK